MDEQVEQSAAQEKPMSQVIYCGPTLPREYGLSQYQVFVGGLPPHVQRVTEQFPVVKTLIVPVEELAQTRISMTKEGSAEAAQFQEILTAIRSEKGGK